ncbi:MAG: hypothetical protein ACC608_03620, partial [Anaerofustis sp.]
RSPPLFSASFSCLFPPNRIFLPIIMKRQFSFYVISILILRYICVTLTPFSLFLLFFYYPNAYKKTVTKDGILKKHA